MTSRSLWDEHLQAIGRSQKFTLNRFNYDAMADVLLPRAVGYAAGFLDAFFRGSVGAGFEDQRMTIWASTEAMEGTFQLLYDMDDGTRRELASWALRIDPEGSSQVVAPQLPPEAGPGASCWLIFRGQLGDESGAVVGDYGRLSPSANTSAARPLGALLVHLRCLRKSVGRQVSLRDHRSSARQ